VANNKGWSAQSHVQTELGLCLSWLLVTMNVPVCEVDCASTQIVYYGMFTLVRFVYIGLYHIMGAIEHPGESRREFHEHGV
jgi:hypothetical protein